jgi:hypothetical protein
MDSQLKCKVVYYLRLDDDGDDVASNKYPRVPPRCDSREPSPVNDNSASISFALFKSTYA